MNRSHKPHKRPAHPTQEDNSSPALWFAHLARALLFTAGIGALLCVVASLIAYFTTDPDRWIRPLGLCASYLTALLGGAAATRIHKRSALLCGLLLGCACTVLMLLPALLLKPLSSGYSPMVSCLLHTGFFLCSVAGAYLGLPRVEKSKKRR